MQKFLHAVKKVTEYHQNNPFWLRKQVVKYNDKVCTIRIILPSIKI